MSILPLTPSLFIYYISHCKYFLVGNIFNCKFNLWALIHILLWLYLNTFILFLKFAYITAYFYCPNSAPANSTIRFHSCLKSIATITQIKLSNCKTLHIPILLYFYAFILCLKSTPTAIHIEMSITILLIYTVSKIRPLNNSNNHCV